MGQAKKRGTFEQRSAWAEARNKAVLTFISTKATNEEQQGMKDILAHRVKHFGIQKVASSLERAGMLTIAGKQSISH